MSDRSKCNTQLNAFIFLICALLLGSISCTDPDCKNTLYDLEVNLSVQPASTSYTTADTIDLTINVPIEILNRYTNEVERVKLFEVDFEFHVARIDSVVPDEELFADNTYDNITIIMKSPDVRTDFVPGSIYLTPALKGDTSYVSNIAFSLNKPGVYYMYNNGFNDEDLYFAGENLKDNILLVDGCKKARVNVFNKINGGASNNLDILCDTRESLCTVFNKPEDRTEYFDRRAGYIFRVTE